MNGAGKMEAKPMGRVLVGIVIGIVLVPLAGLGYLKYGRPPVAAADPPLPMEKFVTGIPLKERIEYEQVNDPPIKAGEDTFVAGAHIYAQECAVCHGFHGQPSRFGMHMAPAAPPLWEKRGPGSNQGDNQADTIGVSGDELGATYWKVANGISLTGMPSFKGILTPAQIWQVSLLLQNASKPLPPAAVALLKGEAPQTGDSGTDSGSGAASGSTAQAGTLKAPAGMKFAVANQAN
jgi:thiosulfate dehydrogenase